MLKTIKQASEFLGLPESTIRRFSKMEKSKRCFHQFGGQTSIVWVDTEELLKLIRTGKLDS